MGDDERHDVKCTVSAQDWAKIEELAKRMEVSPSRMATLLLRAGIQDNETIIRIVSTDFMKRIKAGLDAVSEEFGKKKPARRRAT